MNRMDDLAHAVTEMELLPGYASRLDFLENLTLDAGGSFHRPQRRNNWDSQTWTAKALGVSAEADDPDALVHQWMAAAARMVRDRQTGLADAEALLRDLPSEIRATKLEAACGMVLAESRDPELHERARMLLETIAQGAAA